MSLEDIFDAPLDESFPPASSRTRTDRPNDDDDQLLRPSKRPRSSLFLADSDEEREGPPDVGARRSAAPKTPSRDIAEVDIDAMFADLDEASLALAPALDMNALQKSAREEREKELALTPHAILPSSSPAKDADYGGSKGRVFA
jgi:replication fork protection complex subunit Csm3/Swi3